MVVVFGSISLRSQAAKSKLIVRQKCMVPHGNADNGDDRLEFTTWPQIERLIGSARIVNIPGKDMNKEKITAAPYWTLINKIARACLEIPNYDLSSMCSTLSMVYGRTRSMIKDDIMLEVDQLRVKK